MIANLFINKYFTSKSLFLKDMAELPPKSLISKDPTKGGLAARGKTMTHTLTSVASAMAKMANARGRAYMVSMHLALSATILECFRPR